MKNNTEVNDLVKMIFSSGEYQTIKPYEVDNNIRWSGEVTDYIVNKITLDNPESYKLYVNNKLSTIYQLSIKFRPKILSYDVDPAENGIDELGKIYDINKIFRIKYDDSSPVFDWVLVEKDYLGIKKYKLYVIDLTKPETKPSTKGILIFYINVGNLVPQKAEQYMKRVMENFSSESDYSIPISRYWFPIRNGDTKVEFISFEAENAKTIEEFMEDTQKQLINYIEIDKNDTK